MKKVSRTIRKGKPSTGRFLRFGGLSPVKQRGFTTDKEATFHSPPARKGVYAFPENCIEIFLLGGGYGDPDTKGGANRFTYVKDSKGVRLTQDHPAWKSAVESEKYWPKQGKLKEGAVLNEDGEYYDYDDHEQFLIEKVHPRRFEYTGDIWHHLDTHTPRQKIKQRKGSWVKTSTPAYLEAFKRMYHSQRKEMGFRDREWVGDSPYTPPCFKNALKYYSKDHLEVFIERIK